MLTRIFNSTNTRRYCTQFLALGFSVIIMNNCTPSEGMADEKKIEADNSNTVELISVEKSLLASSLTMPGELISFQQVDLYAKVISFVKKIYVDVGSEVKAGQVLATLEAPEISSQLAGAESRWKSFDAIYTSSKANYERLKETSKTSGTVSPNDLDMALAKMNSDFSQMESAAAAFREINQTLDYLTIKAPFGGVISARNINPGAYVGPSGRGSDNPLFTLQEQKHLRLVVSVPEDNSPYVEDGDELNFRIKSLPADTFIAKVSRMSGALDSRLRSQRVEADVYNTNGKLLPGMVARVMIPLINRDSTFIIPKTAVVSSQENVFVIKFEEGKAQWLNVQTGRSMGGKIEVYGNLRKGDKIVSKASEEIRNGSVLKN